MSKISMTQQQCSAGVSLVEVILAVALFSMIAVLVFEGQWKIGDTLLHNARIVSAANAARDSMTFSGRNEAEQISVQEGPFHTSRVFFKQPFSRCAALEISESFWQTGWGTTASTSFSFFLPDLQDVLQYGKDCGGQTKKFSDSGFTPVEQIEFGEPGTVAGNVDVFRGTAFVGLQLAASASETEPDLVFVGLNSQNSSFETTFFRAGRGINKVDAASLSGLDQDTFVFTANNSSTTQLSVVGVLGGVLATSTLPGVAGARPEAVSIFYADSKIYIGTKRTAGHEFHIYDVSNPASPRWLGSREMNHNINDIVVKDDYAFLATSGNVRDLIVLNVHDPTRISEALQVDLPGTEDGRSVYISGNYIFLGRHKGTQPGRDELCVLKYWFDEGGVLATSLVGSVSTGGDVTSIRVAAGSVFVSTTNALREFQVFNFSVHAPFGTSTHSALTPVVQRNLDAAASSIDVENDMFAVTFGNQLVLYEQN